MLTLVLEALKAAGPQAELKDLSRRMGVEPATLQGMLDTLVELGRLEKHLAGSPACIDCPLSASCSPSRSGACYVLTAPGETRPAGTLIVQGQRANLD
jgi:hypothetical protein